MHIPIFGKTVTFSHFPGIAIAVCTIVPFYKSSVDCLTNRRCIYRSLYIRFTAKYGSQFNINYPTFPAYLVNCSIFQTFHWNPARTFRTATFAGSRWPDVSPVSLQNSLFIRFILVRCNQIHNMTVSSLLKISHKFINIFSCAFARYNANYQPMFRIVSNVIPVISLVLVSRVLLITMFFLLAYKGPFFIKLYLISVGGKTLPVHHEAIWHVFRLRGNTVLPCLDVPLQDGWSFARHNFPKYGLTERPFFPQAVAVQTAVYLFVRKIASCMFGSIAAECGCFCRTSRILSDYLRRVFHNPGIFYSDNRILKEPALSCLLNLTVYGATTCPSFRISARQHKFIQY